MDNDTYQQDIKRLNHIIVQSSKMQKLFLALGLVGVIGGGVGSFVYGFIYGLQNGPTGLQDMFYDPMYLLASGLFGLLLMVGVASFIVRGAVFGKRIDNAYRQKRQLEKEHQEAEQQAAAN